MHRSKYLALGATAVAGLFLAACSSTATVSASEIADTVRQNLADEVGEPVEQIPAVTCPGEIDAVVGAFITCSLIGSDGITLDIAVTLTAIEDGKAYFSSLVADEPN